VLMGLWLCLVSLEARVATAALETQAELGVDVTLPMHAFLQPTRETLH
jgi:hypothetical protein